MAVVRETERGPIGTLSIVHIHNLYGKDVYTERFRRQIITIEDKFIYSIVLHVPHRFGDRDR